MATVRVFHRFNQSEIRALLSSRDGPVARALMVRGTKVVSAAKRRISTNPKRVDTGRLRSSIASQLGTKNSKLVMRVGTNVKYAMFIHEGTGIYGPRGTRIVPKRSSVLKWTNREGTFYAKSVRGIVPNPFLKDALQSLRR